VRRFSRVLTLGISTVALATALFASSAGAGIVPPPSDVTPLTILKTVSGPVPAGTTFTATVECDDTIILPGNSDTATVTFDETGQPTSPDTIEFDDPGTCTVTETVNGGASSTTYACESTLAVDSVSAQQVAPLCPTAGPQADPMTVNVEVEDGSVTVTIANTFTAPTPPPVTPAAQIVAQPAFTG
jgi:hypothetical protein